MTDFEASGSMEEILRGWKEIEAYLGMGRKAIIRAGYPVRRESNSRNIMALRSEILAFVRKKKLIGAPGGEVNAQINGVD